MHAANLQTINNIPRGDSWYFRTGVCHFMVSISSLSGIFDEKIRFRGLFWENGFHFPNIFLSLWIFSQSNQSIQPSLVCHLCHQNNWPYLECLPDMIALSRIFVKNHVPFSEFFLENMTLIRGTPPCTPHVEVHELIAKRNKLWKRFRDSLKIRNISNLCIHCTA